jgi:hypothetical protein
MTVTEEQGEQTKQFFLANVNQLFDDIKNWLADKELHIEQRKVQINEESTGLYTAPTLVISTHRNEKLAEIKPYGACIIEAKGRIDVEGLFRIENIGYFVNGGPHLSADRQLYKEVDADGWYWVANTREPKAAAMNKELLLKLIKSVSHYEFQSA